MWMHDSFNELAADPLAEIIWCGVAESFWPKCKGCRKWMTPEHVQSDSHQRSLDWHLLQLGLQQWPQAPQRAPQQPAPLAKAAPQRAAPFAWAAPAQAAPFAMAAPQQVLRTLQPAPMAKAACRAAPFPRAVCQEAPFAQSEAAQEPDLAMAALGPDHQAPEQAASNPICGRGAFSEWAQWQEAHFSAQPANPQQLEMPQEPAVSEQAPELTHSDDEDDGWLLVSETKCQECGQLYSETAYGSWCSHQCRRMSLAVLPM